MCAKDFRNKIKAIEKDSIHGSVHITLSLLFALMEELRKNKIKNQTFQILISTLKTIHPEMTALHKSLDNIVKKCSNRVPSEKIMDIINDEIKRIQDFERLTAENLSYKLSNFSKIMILSSSSTIDTALINFRKNHNIDEIIVLESRPLFEGRNTARKLIEVGYKVTLIVDAAASLVAKDIDAIILGADTIFADRSVLNKVGSFSLALIANYHQIPLIVGASTNKCTSLNSQNYFHLIKMQDPKEIWKNSPSNIKLYNIYFDLIPAKYITEIISENL